MYHEYLAIKIELANNEIIPEKWKSSATQYERYPKQKISVHSTTGFTVRNLKFFVTMELTIPVTIPTKIEKKLKLIKLPTILNGVDPVNSESGPEYSITVLNKIIQTASFVIPSPNTKLKSLGCSSYLMIEMAATTSVQHNNEHISKISIIERVNCSYSLYSNA